MTTLPSSASWDIIFKDWFKMSANQSKLHKSCWVVSGTQTLCQTLLDSLCLAVDHCNAFCYTSWHCSPSTNHQNSRVSTSVLQHLPSNFKHWTTNQLDSSGESLVSSEIHSAMLVLSRISVRTAVWQRQRNNDNFLIFLQKQVFLDDFSRPGSLFQLSWLMKTSTDLAHVQLGIFQEQRMLALSPWPCLSWSVFWYHSLSVIIAFITWIHHLSWIHG